ncbi:hypothetical protein Trydic_g19785 [Trypoxylus dichotomus]
MISGNIADVDRMVIHPSYNPTSLKHDIAVILLKKGLRYDWKVGIIEMARKIGLFPQHATIVGWGCTACIWFIPIWLCQLFPPSKQLRFGELVLERMEQHTFVSTSRVKSCPEQKIASDINGYCLDKDPKYKFPSGTQEVSTSESELVHCNSYK